MPHAKEESPRGQARAQDYSVNYEGTNISPDVGVGRQSESKDSQSYKASFLATIRERVRTDAFGEGHFDAGRLHYRRINRPLTDDVIALHCDGGPPIGVYPMCPCEDVTRLAVFDLDDHEAAIGWEDMAGVAMRLTASAKRFGIYLCAIRSGGGRGIHLWAWWSEAQPACNIRSVFREILAEHGFRDGVAGIGNGEVEVFPKQDSISKDDFGSLIALPFARQSVLLSEEMQPRGKPRNWLSSSPIPQLTRSLAGTSRQQSSMASPAIVEAALKDVPNNDVDYKTWLNVGMALHDGLGDDGLSVFMAWSAQSAKHVAKKAQASWRSFKRKPGGITVRTLFAMARLNGWEPPAGFDPRRVIRLHIGASFSTLEEIRQVLADEALYQQGNRIVRVVEEPVPTHDGRKVLATRIGEASADFLFPRIEANARFERYDERSKTYKQVGCPKELPKLYLASDGNWGLQPLLGVVTAPTLRSDGSILQAPGYDERSGILFDPLGVTFPEIPEAPTRDQALAALAQLKALIGTFPFESDADRAVALSGIQTAVIRRALTAAPMHAYSAPTAGSGKSMLVDLAAIIATGKHAPVTSTGYDNWSGAELEKRLVASLLAGDAVVSLDNLDEALRSDFLCQALTQPMLKLRRLGASTNYDTPVSTSFFATGNNLVVAGDLTRRVLIANLDPKCERPELREFDSDPLRVATENRLTFVVAVLTITRAFLHAGAPRAAPPLGSFGAWSQMVRDPLIWLDEADPVDVMERVRAGDPRLAALTEVLHQWKRHIGIDTVVSARDVAAKAIQPSSDEMGSPYEFPEFRDALCRVAPGDSREEVSVLKLGWWLKRNEKRIITLDDGASYRLVSLEAPGHHGRPWSLKRESAPRGMGDLGV